MKKTSIIVILVFLILNFVFGQAPKSFKYQAVVRDVNGYVINTHNVSLQISIVQDTSSGGTIVYSETFTNIKPTNLGMVNLDIGKGTIVTGNFSKIDWGNHKFYIGINMDPNGGSNYQAMGTSELLSVPYALYAATAGNSGGSNLSLTGTGSTTVTGSYPNYTINGGYQYLRYSNDTIYLTNGGFVKLPYTAGTGIDLTGTIINNTMPNATHTGDVIGSGALTVIALQGNPISSILPTNNQILNWNGSNWSPSTININTYYAGTGLALNGNTFSHISHTGDATGQTNLTVISIQGKPVVTTTPTLNQVLSWNGNYWTPTSNAGQPYYAGTGLSIMGNTFYHLAHTGDATGQTNLTVVALQGNPIATTAPTVNQLLIWNGSTWTPTYGAGTHYIGQLYGGGIIYWVDYTGSHGYIISIVDVSAGDVWSNVSTALIGATAQSTWDGKSNTTAITSQTGFTGGAALDCQNYINSNYGTGFYNDWYLPATDELNYIYNARLTLNKILSSVTGANIISQNAYWSSTELNSNYAWYYIMSSGTAANSGGAKYISSYVRAVRTF